MNGSEEMELGLVEGVNHIRDYCRWWKYRFILAKTSPGRFGHTVKSLRNTSW